MEVLHVEKIIGGMWRAHCSSLVSDTKVLAIYGQNYCELISLCSYRARNASWLGYTYIWVKMILAQFLHICSVVNAKSYSKLPGRLATPNDRTSSRNCSDVLLWTPQRRGFMDNPDGRT